MSRLPISRGILNTILPPIPEARKWISQYRATPERPLIDLSQGVPGVPPPALLQKTVSDIAARGEGWGYCHPLGDDALREALAKDVRHVYGSSADVNPDDVAITAGCNMAFAASIMALADAGDQVILPEPWYFNHQMTLTMLGMTPVPLPTIPGAGFLPDLESCQKLITDKTKAIVLVTPNNPTGAIYPPSLLLDFFRLATEKKVALIIDETYRDFLSGTPHELFTPGLINWRDTLVHLYSFSKAYGIPGSRVGAIIASPSFLEHVTTVLDNVQICPPRQIQLALGSVLPQLRPYVQNNSLAINKRHKIFKETLPKKWEIAAQGGYYAFVRHPFKDIQSKAVCERLAKDVGVASLPGSFFCGDSTAIDHWIRFSVANVSDEQIHAAGRRLRECEGAFGWETV